MTSSVSDKMMIPKKIKVGFQKRDGTYTGKLAYVIYYDHKGVLRKETSWEGWRHKDVEPQEFDNAPTTGFVLNKKAGGTHYGWNPRQTYVRIYDPRDFEFELTIPNLLFVLQETNSIKGKGLDGEFVYAWDGTDLVLLPVESEEYKKCMEFTDNQSMKIGKADMVEGHTYQMKDMTRVMYLGRHEWSDKVGKRYEPDGLKHVFLNLDNPNDRYIPQAGYTKLAKKLSAEVATNFSDEYEAFKKSLHNSKFVGVELVKKEVSQDVFDRADNNYWGRIYLIAKRDGKFVPVQVEEEYEYRYKRMYGTEYPAQRDARKKQFNLHWGKPITLKLENVKDYREAVPEFTHNTVPVENPPSWSWRRDQEEIVPMDLEDVLKGEYYTINVVTDKGTYDLLEGGFYGR